MNKKFAVCDDSKEHRERLAYYIKREYDSRMSGEDESEIIYYESGGELLDKHISDGIDVYFLDIECGAMNGFDIAREIVKANKNAGIVYCTSFSNYVSEAFVCRPLGFIKKADIERDVAKVIYSVCDYLRDGKNILITKKGVTISIDNIIAVEVFIHNLIFYDMTGELKIRATLSEYENKLKQYGFIKVSRNAMVNRYYIKNYEKNNIIMRNGKEFGISRNYVDDVRGKLR